MTSNSRNTPDTNPPNTGSGSNNNNSNGNNNSGSGRPFRNSNSVVHMDTNSFEGATSDIGAVLGLRHEKFKHKTASFESFLEKVSTYAISNFKDGGDLKPLFRKMTDPSKSFKKKKKPTAPEPEDENAPIDPVDLDIYREQIKLYVARESNLRRNMEETFGIIWEQCSNSLQSNLKGHDEFEDA